jgi:anti-anti-sigma factor
VTGDGYRGRWTGRQAVVRLPEHLDVSSAPEVSGALLAAINRGAEAVTADMSATVSCDHAGADALARVYQRAVISGTQFRLVLTAPVVRRVLSLSGIDRVVPAYPSLEAAAAARVPAPGAAPAWAAVTVLTGPGGRAPGGGGLPAGQPMAAGAPDGDGAVITAEVLRRVLDVLPDGVAVADSRGSIMLASRRLEEMFGYGRGELAGRPVAALLPGGGQAAWPHEPEPGATGAGARLAGLRKDGTTFPAEVTISPVPAGAGHTAVVIGDATGALRPEDLTGLAATQQQHRVRDLLDTVITTLFAAGLSLQAAATDPPTQAAGARITALLGDLDDAIHAIRDTMFTTTTTTTAAHHPLPHRAPAPGQDTHA